jgi:hypothetical protein
MTIAFDMLPLGLTVLLAQILFLHWLKHTSLTGFTETIECLLKSNILVSENLLIAKPQMST